MLCGISDKGKKLFFVGWLNIEVNFSIVVYLKKLQHLVASQVKLVNECVNNIVSRGIVANISKINIATIPNGHINQWHFF